MSNGDHSQKVLSRLRHDLKGGLLTLRMGLEALDPSEALREPLLEKASELVTLSDQFLLWLRAGQVQLAEVSSSSFFEQTIKKAQETFSSLQFSWHGATSLSRWYIDPDVLLDAFLQLCANASQAKASKVHVEVSVVDSQAVVTIDDDGQGFPQGQDPSNLDSWHQGTGLGLAIVTRCLESHHGQAFWSSLNPGTRVTLKFCVGQS